MKLALRLLAKHLAVGSVVYAASRSKDVKRYPPRILELLPEAGESAAALVPWLDALYKEMRTLLDTFKAHTSRNLPSYCKFKKTLNPKTTEFVSVNLYHCWNLVVEIPVQLRGFEFRLSLAVDENKLISSIAFGLDAERPWDDHEEAWTTWKVDGRPLYEKWEKEKEYEGQHWYPVAIEDLPERSEQLKAAVERLSKDTAERIMWLCDRGGQAAI